MFYFSYHVFVCVMHSYIINIFANQMLRPTPSPREEGGGVILVSTVLLASENV